MRLHITEDYEELSFKAASLVSSQVILNPDSVLGLATGSTPLGMYDNLITMYNQENIDFKEVVTFNLDEYLGISPSNQQSYYYYMYNNFFNHVNIPEANIHIPIVGEDNLEQVCSSYDKQINQAGGIDLQVLGVGINGHIGFNEPDNKLNAKTHVVKLAQKTIEANSRFFDSKEEVPRRAISMGIGNILKADKIILLASGNQKAEAIKRVVNGKVTTQWPASLLNLHDNLTIIVDKQAASLI